MDRVYHVDVRSLLFIHVNTINLLFIFVYLYLYQYVPINGCTLINVPGPQMVWSPPTHTPPLYWNVSSDTQSHRRFIDLGFSQRHCPYDV